VNPNLYIREVYIKNMFRLFICVWIPDRLKEDIAKFQKKLSDVGVKGKFIEMENLHVTIAFLGDVNESEIEKIKRNLDYIAKKTKSFHVKLKGINVIPNENFIRIIGISIDDKNNELSDIINMVGKSIGGKYHQKQKLTLCRVKKISEISKLKKMVMDYHDIYMGELHVKSLFLVKSILTKNGPKYETLYESVLK